MVRLWSTWEFSTVFLNLSMVLLRLTADDDRPIQSNTNESATKNTVCIGIGQPIYLQNCFARTAFVGVGGASLV